MVHYKGGKPPERKVKQKTIKKRFSSVLLLFKGASEREGVQGKGEWVSEDPLPGEYTSV